MKLDKKFEVGEKVTFEHDGKVMTGKVDWLFSDENIAVMVEGQPRPFSGCSTKFKRVK